MTKPIFNDLWSNYPTSRSPCTGSWANQCAIRMSLTLNGEGSILVNSTTYSEPKCAHGHARGAESLANWLWKYHLKRPTIFTDTGKVATDLKSRNGIIFFKDCFTRAGETRAVGDHIDLWRKGTTKTGSYASQSSQVWFWALT